MERFQHFTDCDKCTFLAHDQYQEGQMDVYYCPQHGYDASILLRFGDEAWEFHSFWITELPKFIMYKEAPLLEQIALRHYLANIATINQ